MDKDARAKLIRQRAKARKLGTVTEVKPARFKWWEVYGTGQIAGGNVTLCETREKPWRGVEWVEKANPTPEPTVEPDKRQKGPRALTLIAEKWDQRHVGKPAAIGKGFRQPRGLSVADKLAGR